MKFIIPFLSIFFLQLSLNGQHDIQIKMENYESDSLIIGYYYGERTLVHDTLVNTKKRGEFRMKGDESLDAGVYMLLTKPDNAFIQFLVNAEDQKFKIHAGIGGVSNIEYNGSEENEAFVDYLNFLGMQRDKAQPFRQEIADADSTGKDATKARAELELVDQSVEDKQNEIIEQFPNAALSMIIQGNQDLKIPDFDKASEDYNKKRYTYFKQHYFDYIDLGNPMTLRTPFIHEKIMYYVEKLTPLAPDSINASIDSILTWTKPAEDTYQYYLSHFLNTYARNKMIGMDAVYVHLVDNYYADGKAPWVDEENLVKITDNAEDIRPTLIGKTGQDIKVYKEDGKTTFSISELPYERYLVLMFWAPDCGHCTKSMPQVVEFYEEYKSKGVELVAICTKHMDKTQSCWDALEDKNMLGFINGADQYHRSKFKTKYNVVRTPKIYVLDKEMKIVMKDLGAEHLSDVMEEIFMQDAKKLEQQK